MGAEPQAVLTISDLAVRYDARGAVVRAVSEASLRVGPGRVVAIVGESGSGKSTVAHSVMGLLPAGGRIDAGRIDFASDVGPVNLASLSPRRMRTLRGRQIALIPQDPGVSLNPTKRIGAQVAEVLLVHGMASPRQAAALAEQALADAGLDDPSLRARQYPHQLSGGMRQRVLIAMAFVADPRLVIADEPTSALDVTVQKRILDHLGELVATRHTSVLLITHDLGIAADRADDVVVMSRGRVVEAGPTLSVLSDPQHAYTRQLLADAPSTATSGALAVEAASASPAARLRERVRLAPPSGDAAHAEGPPLLQVRGLVKDFPHPGHAGRRAEPLRAVDDVSFSLARGRTLALVGESGSGKSTTARMSIGLLAPTSGSVTFDGLDLGAATRGELRRARRAMQIVYQNPYTSLSPRLSIAQIVEEPLRIFRVGNRRSRADAAASLVDRVALPSSVLGRRAVELSGGQRQRVAIARALALSPSLVVCDEPVSALDVTVQAQILSLLMELQDELGLSYLFISHDLAVVRLIADEVAVMRQGTLVEFGATEQVYEQPAHAYTRELLDAVPARHAGLS